MHHWLSLGYSIGFGFLLVACSEENTTDEPSSKNDTPSPSRSDTATNDAGATTSSSESTTDEVNDETLPTGAAGDCAQASPTFSAVSQQEYVQWDYGAGEQAAQSDTTGIFDYYLPDQGVIVIYASTANSVLTLTLGELEVDPVPAGTYTCADGLGVVLSGVGAAISLGADAGADCAITFDADVGSGGRLTGSFWAFLPSDIANPGGCVHGRFGLTDKE